MRQKYWSMDPSEFLDGLWRNIVVRIAMVTRFITTRTMRFSALTATLGVKSGVVEKIVNIAVSALRNLCRQSIFARAERMQYNKSLQRTLGTPAHFATAKYTNALMAAEFNSYIAFVR